MALNYDLFVVQNKFAPSGLNGVATMIDYLTGGRMNLAYMSLIINMPLCMLAYFLVEKDFALKTGAYCVIYSGVYLLLSKTNALGSFRYDAKGADTIYPVLISGVISGFAYGMAFRRNGSTGGTDVISKFVNKKVPNLNFVWVLFALNAVVAISSYFVYTDINPETGAVIRNYKPEEIDKEIVEKLKHSATKMIGTGVYSNTERDVIICVVSRHQIVDFENIIKKYPDTFAFVETVNETIGNFKKVKRRSDDTFYYVDEN